MRADELRQAVGRISEILVRADIRGAVDRFRAARGDDRTVAAARLGHAGGLVMERFEALSPAERLVVRSMHLQDLARPAYWETLMRGSADPKAVAGELVRLTSRVVFATGQLPGLVGLLEHVEGAPRARHPVAEGEARLVVRLADAGERASDPDRVARTIDGVDMLYSACASIARKPAMDLRLEAVDGGDVRDVHLTGEREAIGAVVAVLESIPDAVGALDEDADIDLEELVRSLPVFTDLATLGRLGSFSEADLKDITETMHQGALLALESGVVLVPAAVPLGGPAARAVPDTASGTDSGAGSRPAVIDISREGGSAAPSDAAPSVLVRRSAEGSNGASPPQEAGNDPRPVDDAPTDGAAPSGADDRHYDAYLREREAMRRSAPRAADDSRDDAPSARIVDEEVSGQTRKDAVEEMLRSLGKARDGS